MSRNEQAKPNHPLNQSGDDGYSEYSMGEGKDHYEYSFSRGQDHYSYFTSEVRGKSSYGYASVDEDERNPQSASVPDVYGYERQTGNLTDQFDYAMPTIIEESSSIGQIHRKIQFDGDREISIFNDQWTGYLVNMFDIEIEGNSHYTELEVKKFISTDSRILTSTSDLTYTQVAGSLNQDDWRWDWESRDWNSSYELVEFQGQNLMVVYDKHQDNATEVEIFQDRDVDGVWAKIAEFETTGYFLDVEGRVDFVGLTNLDILDPSMFYIA